jgi:hypothetical protein
MTRLVLVLKHPFADALAYIERASVRASKNVNIVKCARSNEGFAMFTRADESWR